MQQDWKSFVLDKATQQIDNLLDIVKDVEQHPNVLDKENWQIGLIVGQYK